jgi:hypothetical protein
LLHRSIRQVPLFSEDDQAVLRARRKRWIAKILAQTYDLSWVPEEWVSNIKHIEVDPRGAVVMTLWSGSKLVDRLDRIDVVGTVDDVAVDELVVAIQRRKWDAVEVHGSPAFRRAIAGHLAVLDPPVAVVDNPLSDDELAQLRPLPGSDGEAPNGSPTAPRSSS